MNKKAITAVLIWMFGQASAQTFFYIKPTIDMKNYVSSTYGLGFNSILRFSDQLATNPYFQANNLVMSLRSNIQIGFYAGANFRDGKHLIEVGWNQDATGSALETSFFALRHGNYTGVNPDVKGFNDFGTTTKSTLFTQRFTVQYSRLLNAYSRHKNKLYFNVGSGIVFNPSGTGYRRRNVSIGEPSLFEGIGDSISMTYLDSNITMPMRRHLIYPYYKFAGFLSIGMMADFRTKKEKYLFSATLMYVQGFKVLEQTVHEFTINDNGDIKEYAYATVSKGSGIYLQLSRRITVHRMKKKIETL